MLQCWTEPTFQSIHQILLIVLNCLAVTAAAFTAALLHLCLRLRLCLCGRSRAETKNSQNDSEKKHKVKQKQNAGAAAEVAAEAEAEAGAALAKCCKFHKSVKRGNVCTCSALRLRLLQILTCEIRRFAEFYGPHRQCRVSERDSERMRERERGDARAAAAACSIP